MLDMKIAPLDLGRGILGTSAVLVGKDLDGTPRLAQHRPGNRPEVVRDARVPRPRE